MTLIEQPPKKIYIWVEAQPITTAGIYHNSDLGLISLSSDGSNWITIADKNLGATSTDITSTDSYGNLYQRGNCYGFPYTGTTKTSNNTVNVTNYGPGNYYTSDTFVWYGDTWMSSANYNLWGGSTGTYEARRGPCPEGQHVPSRQDFASLYNTMSALGKGNSNGYYNYLKFGKTGSISEGTNTHNQGSGSQYYLSSDLYSVSYMYICLLSTGGTIYTDLHNVSPSRGFPIRPFKNEAVQPREGWTRLDA